jgi:voltage-gated potassium channel
MDEEKTTEHRSRDFERRQELLELIDRRTGLLLLVLAIAMIPLLIIPLLWDLSARLEFALFAFDGFIWAVFVIDIGVKIAVAPDRPRYLKEHWIEVIVAAVPFFRPLRVVRAVLFVLRAFFGARRLLGADFILIYAVGIVVVSAFMVNALETGDPESTIRSSPDALW